MDDHQSSELRKNPELEVKDPVAARKVQKADREKLRRDKLNEQFLDLGNTLDPDRPKNDKATILTDTVQVLKDLTAEVNRLKSEYDLLSEESRELTQEKNELREEKASLKSDIENLNVQYQQRARVMFPWAGMEPSVVMAPSYTYPMPLPVTQGPIPMHPTMQPYHFYGNHAPGAIPAPVSTFIPFPTATASSPAQVSSSQHASSSHGSSNKKSKNKPVDERRNAVDRSDCSTDVVTELELKMPGSSANQDTAAVERKRRTSQERIVLNESSPNISSQGLDSSSNCVEDGSKVLE